MHLFSGVGLGTSVEEIRGPREEVLSSHYVGLGHRAQVVSLTEKLLPTDQSLQLDANFTDLVVLVPRDILINQG